MRITGRITKLEKAAGSGRCGLCSARRLVIVPPGVAALVRAPAPAPARAPEPAPDPAPEPGDFCEECGQRIVFRLRPPPHPRDGYGQDGEA